MKTDELLTLLHKNFGLETIHNGLATDSEYFKHLQKMLSERIKFFIRTDLDKLLQILYRIDVPQKETDQSFELGEIHAVSSDLAEKIIRRQLKKIEYARNFYKKDD